MTVHALAEFAVDGYQHFRQAFVGNPSGADSCESARVFGSDPDGGGGDDRVVVRTRWPDRDAFAHFRAEMERDMASGGDMAPPVISEVDAAEGDEAVRGLVETEDLLETRRTAAP